MQKNVSQPRPMKTKATTNKQGCAYNYTSEPTSNKIIQLIHKQSYNTRHTSN